MQNKLPGFLNNSYLYFKIRDLSLDAMPHYYLKPLSNYDLYSFNHITQNLFGPYGIKFMSFSSFQQFRMENIWIWLSER